MALGPADAGLLESPRASIIAMNCQPYELQEIAYLAGAIRRWAGPTQGAWHVGSWASRHHKLRLFRGSGFDQTAKLKGPNENV